MKIAIDCRMITMSGIGTYLENILSILLCSKEFKEFLLIGDSNILDKYATKINCNILECKIPIFSFKELLFFPVDEVNKYDIFYSPNYNIPAKIKIKIAVTIHDVVFLDIDGLSSKLGKVIRKYAIQRALRISNLVFTVSNFSKDRIYYHFKPQNEIIVTYNSIKQNLVNFETSQFRTYNFNYVLYVGNFKKHKGVDLLLEAYVSLKKNGYDKMLIVVGNFNYLKTYDESSISRIRELINKNELILTGNISDKQLYEIMFNADILVQPSYYEGFGIPPLEALYLGTNVIVSDISVFKEIYKCLPVTYFKNGDSNDLMKEMLKHYVKIDSNKTREIISKQYNASSIVAEIIKNIIKLND